MRYRNPPLTALEAPAKETREFVLLITVVGGLFASGLAALMLFVTWFAAYIPFSAERALARTMPLPYGLTLAADPADHPQRDTLQALAERVVQAMEPQPAMAITVHYVDEPVVNAFATLGGHLFVFRGLLEKLDSEDAVAAVLAHEIGHVRGRHVIKGMGRGVALVLALQAVGIKSRGLTQWAIGEGATLAVLAYSREAEREADQAALAAVERLYGHVGGIADLFDLFVRETDGGIEILKTHPLPANRRSELLAQAAASGYAAAGRRTPLPTTLTIGAASRTP